MQKLGKGKKERKRDKTKVENSDRFNIFLL